MARFCTAEDCPSARTVRHPGCFEKLVAISSMKVLVSCFFLTFSLKYSQVCKYSLMACYFPVFEIAAFSRISPGLCTLEITLALTS